MLTPITAPELRACVTVLSDGHLRSSIAEAYIMASVNLQLTNPDTGETYTGWRHHPMTKAWRGHSGYLLAFIEAGEAEHRRRRGKGYLKTHKLRMLRSAVARAGEHEPPSWLFDPDVHDTFRAHMCAKGGAKGEPYRRRWPDVVPREMKPADYPTLDPCEWCEEQSELHRTNDGDRVCVDCLGDYDLVECAGCYCWGNVDGWRLDDDGQPVCPQCARPGDRAIRRAA